MLKVIVTNNDITLTTGNLSRDLRITEREQLISSRFQHYPYNYHNLLSRHEKKEAKYILAQQRRLNSWRRSALAQSTLLQPAFEEVPSLVFDLGVLIFLSKIKPMGEGRFYFVFSP